MATRVVTVNDILDGHVGLDLECFDRIYLNGWVHNLQVSGQVVNFLTHHRGFPIPSPAILEKIGLRFRKAVTELARDNDIEVIRFAKGERKLDVMRPHLDRLVREKRFGVAAIGMAQEFARVFTGTTYHPDADGGGIPRFGYHKADRRVTAYCFYLVDEVFGPAFVKVCAYFPYPLKIWLNGHEYAKHAATAAGIGFTELDNGFAATDDPAGLQQLCDTLGPRTIAVFCERWWARLPLPLTDADRAGGYWWDISMRQIEVSRTIVFTAPRHARGFFEALCADNLDIGRPEQMQRGFDPGLARFVPDHVEALVALGELDRAEELLARFEAQAVAVDRASALAGSARCRALLLTARGDDGGAQSALARALGEHDRLAAPFQQARTLLVAGSIHRRAKRRRAARDALREALAIFERLGSPHWADRARDELARIAGRAPSATALTGAEERIAALVAVGRSNREVAAELFLTVSTVEAALWRIYRKLGIRSRTELAATRQGR